MVTITSQPQLVPLTKTSLTGFIKLSDNSEYFISVDYNCQPPVATFDDDLQLEFDKYPSKLAKIVENSATLESFVANLVTFLEDILVSPTDSKHLLTLIKQVANLPSDCVKSIDQDFKQVILRHTDESNREHHVAIQLDSKTPTLTCDLPQELIMSDTWSCQEVLKTFREVISQYQGLWDALDDIDSNCWVIEPEPYTRGAVHRRIVLKGDVSLIVTLDPSQPTTLPRCRFLGSAKSIQPFQNLLDEKADEWDPALGIVENLATILDLELPSKPTEEDSAISIECGVCYCYEMMDQIPEVSCNNETCKQLYHVDCLVEWFRGLPDVRHSFGTVFGECPYCSKPMHIQAVL